MRHVVDLSKFVMKTIEQLQVLVCQPGPNAAYAVEIVTDKCVPTSYVCMHVCMYACILMFVLIIAHGYKACMYSCEYLGTDI